MSRQDRRANRVMVNAELLRRSLRWVIEDSVFADLKPHGNTTWTAVQLVSLAVLWVWSDCRTLTGAFAQAYPLALSLFGRAAVTTYQGLTKALTTWTDQLMPLLWDHLHRRMEESAAVHWRWKGWLPLAVDGSRISLPRTMSNEQAYAAPNYGRGTTAQSRRRWKNKRRRTDRRSQPQRPQMWLTLLWHMGLKMPWAWRMGPTTASEREHFTELLQRQKFPKNTLFCGDAGFVGYPLWQTIVQSGHHFVMRVGGNVRLLRGLGARRCGAGIVHLWPTAVLRQHQPPLVVRVLEFQSSRGKVFVATSVLSESALSTRQVGQLYRLRWGIELQLRAFKQTFGRGTLRSRSADVAKVELEWSLLGLWMIQLFAVHEQIAVQLIPNQTSVALALNAIRVLLANYHEPTTLRRWRACMAAAIQDSYLRRSRKRARYRPAFYDAPTALGPKITNASTDQRLAYQQLPLAA